MSSQVQSDVKPINCYVQYPCELEYRCFMCHGPVHRAYSTSGHTFQDFFGLTREVRGQYICENPMCPASIAPMNPAPLQVLPYKRYSLNVWRWIAQEYKIFHQNAAQIALRIQHVFDVSFKEEQIQRMMDETDAMLSNRIDDRTRKMITLQGMILLGLDGQKPDSEGNALWIFVDLICNRVLRAYVLQNADAGTLRDIVDEILQDFGVKLVGIVSDKQNNITNMHDTYFPSVPHQYCQFHFLQNLWKHIETKDSHLHKSLEKMINGLSIVRMSPAQTLEFEDRGSTPIRMLFAPIEADLKRILRTHTTKFSNFRGIQTYERLLAYVKSLRELLTQGHSDSRLVGLLQKTIDCIEAELQLSNSHYEDCCVLFQRFQAIQSLLNQEGEEKAHIEAVKNYFADLWKELRLNPECPPKKSLRTFSAQMDKTRAEIQQEWVRLYESYERGLFCYFQFPVPVKTSSLLEANFSKEKGEFRRRSGKAHVGYMVRTRGIFELKQQYLEKDEIRELVASLGDNLNPQKIKQELTELSQRKAEETMDWGGFRENTLGWKSMGHIIATESKSTKRGRKKK